MKMIIASSAYSKNCNRNKILLLNYNFCCTISCKTKNANTQQTQGISYFKNLQDYRHSIKIIYSLKKKIQNNKVHNCKTTEHQPIQKQEL
jgi:hypothetical protein